MLSLESGAVGKQSLTAGRIQSLPIVLPDGILLPPVDGTGSLWVSRDPVQSIGEVFLSLIRQFPETGIWPFLTNSTPAWASEEIEEWRAGDSRPSNSNLLVPGEDGDLTGAAGAHPEAARGGRVSDIQESDAADIVGDLASEVDNISAITRRLVLISTPSPSQIPMLIGPQAYNDHPDPLALSRMLEGWQVKWGFVLLSYSQDSLDGFLQWPPQDRSSASRLAGDLFGAGGDAYSYMDPSNPEDVDDLIGGRMVGAHWD